MAAALRQPLAPAGASLLLPLYRRALTDESKGDDAFQATQEAAFSLLCTHCTPGLKLRQPERQTQADLLLMLMSRGERWHAQAAEALHALAGALAPTSVNELLHGAVFSEIGRVRAASARALGVVPRHDDTHDTEGGAHNQKAAHITAQRWLIRFDVDSDCAAAGDAAWAAFTAGDVDGQDDAEEAEEEEAAIAGGLRPDELEAELLPLLKHEQERVRQQIAVALAASGARTPAKQHLLLQKLFELYKANVPPEMDAKQKRIQQMQSGGAGLAEEEAMWRPRQGVALTLAAMAPALRAREQLPIVFAFLKRALGDAHEVVAGSMVSAGREVIDRQPAPDDMVAMLVPMLEAMLKEEATTEVHDRIRQGVVLYMGALAKHIPADDPKIGQVVTRLMGALGTPSEMVQKTISTSLAGLVGKSAVKPKASEYLTEILTTLKETPSYAERRGAAFGLAGLVKGLGIPSLKQHGIMDTLKAMVEDKGKGEQVANAREGALNAFECLCDTLGRLFEPYIITILPLLLTCVSDGSGPVRYAAIAASQRIMSQLSAQGVKMVLPSLLKALDEEKWRTKHAAVELLGSMAYCAPKQLTNTLPQVVPALTEVLTHSHPRVKEGANAALASVGAVIKNPEIAEIVPTLLHALSEPSTHTAKALDALAHCQFEHCVDPPSLALIVPVLHRGLRERSAQSKRKTSHITGNMCSLLAERRDIVPYLNLLLPELQAVLHDPIPEVRSTGAKALGRLCAGLGEEHFPELLPWLLSSLSKDGSAVERAGAAQGLAEVLSALGDAKVAAVLPTILEGCQEANPVAREGFSMLWVHLPVVLGKRFEPFLEEALPIVLAGLADDASPVRDVSFRGAHAIISHYLEAAARLLLPPLRNGLADDNYRIRQSSAELLGTLMDKLCNGEYVEIVEAGQDSPEDSPFRDVPVQDQHELLASLYIARNDVQPGVRSAASAVWKSVVANPPKTLRTILPSLTEQLITGMSSEDEDQQQAAAQALGELVGKLSERVLPTLLPILSEGLATGDEARRTGVCLGLSEMMAAAGREAVTNFLPDLIPCVRSGLCDTEDGVREAAAQAFAALQRLIGAQAIHEIVPALLQLLRSDDPDRVSMGQSGLREVMGTRPQAVVPYLLPKLLSPPIKLSHARALAAVAEVAGAALHTHLDHVLPALLAETYLEADLLPAGNEVDAALRDALFGAASAVTLAVEDDGLHFLLSEIGKATSHKAPPNVRAAGAGLIETLCKNSPHDLAAHHLYLIQALVPLLKAPEVPLQRSGLRGLDTLVKSLPKERYALHVIPLREAISEAAQEHKTQSLAAGVPLEEASLLPGLCLPDGLGPLVAVHLQGLMTGTPELREQSAAALGEAVSLTSSAALKKYVIQITGPLIRIVGDRFPSGVKAAILQTLKLLITKGAILLKPFVPQLQTTFVKALSDPTKLVRERGASALSALISLATRVEPLATELHNGLSSAETGVRTALLCALSGVLRGIAKPLSEALLEKIQTAGLEFLGTAEDDELVMAAASLVGACGKWAPDLGALLDDIDECVTYDASPGEPWMRQLRIIRALMSLLRTVPTAALAPHLSTMFTALGVAARDEKIDLRQPAAHALARLAAAMATPSCEDIAETEAEGGSLDALAEAIAGAVPASLHQLLGLLLEDKVMEVRISALHAVKTLCKLRPALLRANDFQLAHLLVPKIVSGCQDARNHAVKSAAQRTLMHLSKACNWVTPEPPERLLRVHKESAMHVAEFAKRTLQRLATLESENEMSDVDM